jgi:hypothetical protein
MLCFHIMAMISGAGAGVCNEFCASFDMRYNHPLVLAILAASTRLLAPSLLMASER